MRLALSTTLPFRHCINKPTGFVPTPLGGNVATGGTFRGGRAPTGADGFHPNNYS